MSAQQHRHGLGDTPCSGHSHGTTVAAPADEHDFNEMLEEAHPCCQKEAESKEKGLKLRAALDKVDPSQIAERARKSAFSLGGALSDAQLPLCRVGADYPALEEARRAAAAARGPCAGGAGGVNGSHHARGREDDDGDEDDDDDDDLDYLLDDPEIARMGQARVEGMYADAVKLETLRALGFGLHLEVPETEVEAAAGGQFRGAGVVVHLYDPDSSLSASLDLLLEAKAGSYMGTRFLRCRLRLESPVAERLGVRRTPSLMCYKGGVRVAHTEDMSQFGLESEGSVDPGAVDRWLVASGTLEFDPPNLNSLEGASAGRGIGGDSDDDGDGDKRRRRGGGEGGAERYDCGLESCRKTFAHEHFLAAGGGGLPGGFEERF